jgi:hypothetical protein
LTDDQALTMGAQWLDMEAQLNQLRQKYLPIVAKVLPGRSTATFFQIERRVSMIIDLQLSSEDSADRADEVAPAARCVRCPRDGRLALPAIAARCPALCLELLTDSIPLQPDRSLPALAENAVS